MNLPHQRAVAKEGFAELIDVLMAQGAASAESKFLSLCDLKVTWMTKGGTKA